jgi:hypothetical protein
VLVVEQDPDSDQMVYLTINTDPLHLVSVEEREEVADLVEELVVVEVLALDMELQVQLEVDLEETLE